MSAVGLAVTFVLGGLVAALAVVLVGFNIRRVATRTRAQALPESIRREVLARIDTAGMEDGSSVLLLRMVDGPGTDVRSRVGGTPVLPPGTPPPSLLSDQDWTFLAQIGLHTPPLPDAWSRRAVLIFSNSIGTLAACSLEVAEPVSEAPLDGAFARPVRGVDTLRLPLADEGDDRRLVPSYTPGALLRRIPALRQLLADRGDTPERLLPHILVPGIGTHEIDTFHVSLMGGEPELIQSEHETRCGQCSRPMRFLFQLGDVLGLPGDAPVVYVYGCDAHADQVEVRMDMH